MNTYIKKENVVFLFSVSDLILNRSPCSAGLRTLYGGIEIHRYTSTEILKYVSLFEL